MAWWGKNSKQDQRQPRYMIGQDDGAFRRSRTLSGRKPTNQQKAQSARLQEHAKKRRNHIIKLVIISFVGVAALIYWLMTQYVLTVNTIIFSPQPTSSPQVEIYKTTIGDYLNKYPVERFRFILNSKRLSEYVGKKLPESQSVRGSGGGIGYGDFEVVLRQPLVGWQADKQQYFVDAEGVAFNENYFSQPTVSVVDESGVKVGDSGVIASNRFLSFLGRVVSLISETKVGQVEKIVIPPDTARQVNIYLKGRAYPIKTNVDRDPAQQVEDIKKVIHFLNDRGITPRHIDVRVSGRAFYL